MVRKDRFAGETNEALWLQEITDTRQCILVINAMVERFEENHPIKLFITDALAEAAELSGNVDSTGCALPPDGIKKPMLDVYGMYIAAQTREVNGELSLSWTIFKDIGAGLYIERPKDMAVTA